MLDRKEVEEAVSTFRKGFPYDLGSHAKAIFTLVNLAKQYLAVMSEEEIEKIILDSSLIKYVESHISFVDDAAVKKEVINLAKALAGGWNSGQV